MTTPDKPLVVVADDDVHFLRLLEHHISRWSYRVKGVTDKGGLLRELGRETPDLLLMDVRFGEHDGLEILRQIVGTHPGVKVVMLTAFGSIESAISAIRLGAVDYLSKPIDLARLRSVVNHVIDQAEAAQAAPTTPAWSSGGTATATATATATVSTSASTAARSLTRPIYGESRAARLLRDRIAAVAPTDATVLILGESGTGKELVARAVHELGPRRDGPFVPLNVAALPRELVESTLFGHEKGAFTGADQIQRGCCEAADGGTLFLDEIGEMEVNLQAKLLRFLQERSFQRVGQAKPIQVDVRIVAATHRDPLDQIRRGLLREDLYYRLNVVPIQVPPLRERRDDIPMLATRFLETAAKRHRRGEMAFTPEACQALARYDWPGNVRQLENLVERLAILGQSPMIDADVVIGELREASAMGAGVPPASLSGSGNPGEEDLSAFDRIEKQAIMDALREAHGKVRDAARSLGLGQATVYRKIKRYGIPLD